MCVCVCVALFLDMRGPTLQVEMGRLNKGYKGLV